MTRKIGKFLFGWAISFGKWIWDIIDPVKNEEFYKQIDRDYFPKC